MARKQDLLPVLRLSVADLTSIVRGRETADGLPWLLSFLEPCDLGLASCVVPDVGWSLMGIPFGWVLFCKRTKNLNHFLQFDIIQWQGNVFFVT